MIYPLLTIPNAVKEGSINSIIGTHTKSLMVYGNVTLIWASQLPHIPVAVKIASFQWVWIPIIAYSTGQGIGILESPTLTLS